MRLLCENIVSVHVSAHVLQLRYTHTHHKMKELGGRERERESEHGKRRAKRRTKYERKKNTQNKSRNEFVNSLIHIIGVQ